MSVRYTEATSVAVRSARLLESAANGSAHSTYHGITQLNSATPASAAQPAGAVHSRRCHATAVLAATAAASAIAATRRTAASSPPCPSARPRRLGIP
jgi:hypothetical protein